MFVCAGWWVCCSTTKCLKAYGTTEKCLCEVTLVFLLVLSVARCAVSVSKAN